MTPNLRLRPARADDCRRLFDWANDPATRAASFQSDPIQWNEHVAWFEAKRRDGSCLLFIAETKDGAPVAVVRFDSIDEEPEISITVAPEQRGRGLAVEVIDLAVAALFGATDAAAVTARIKPGNVPSFRAFTRAGFAPVASSSDTVRRLVRRAKAD